jgi:homoserine dehydrogenase
VLGMDDIETAYYLRMQASDKPGVMAEVASILGDSGISIEAILQKEPPSGVDEASIILLTHVVQERQMNAAIRQIEALQSIHGDIMRIRLEHLNCD